jgi:DNA-binding beta-propeller fold protein YncE
MKRNLFLLLALATLLFSCKPDQPVNPGAITIGSGVFVLNEGNFQFANSSLTFYDIEADTVINDLFYKVNNAPLGDVAESMALVDGKLYIVVNNSKYIYKVDANTIVCDTTKPYKMGGFYSPREILFVAPDKAYVTDIVGTNIWIINPQEMKHTGTIAMGNTTEKMLRVGNELFVSNWSYYYTDAYSHDSYNTVQVVDLNNDVKVADIEVGKEPNTMAVDKYGHVWVLCEGRSWDEEYDEWGEPYGENPTLWEIDPMLKTATRRYVFKGPYENDDEIMGVASTLRANLAGDKFFLIYNNEVRRFDIATLSLSESFRIAAQEEGMFYNMTIEPRTGDIYVTDAKNYMMNGTVYRYTNDGLLLSSFEAGVIPSAMLFK